MIGDLMMKMGANSGLVFDTPAEPGVTPPGAVTPLHDWMAQLPDNLKANEQIGKHASLEAFSRSALELEGKLEGAVYKPGDDATPDKRREFMQSLGINIPGDADGYKIPVPENLPEGLEVDQEYLKNFRALALASGLSDEQAMAMYKGHTEYNMGAIKTAMDAREAKRTENLNTLKTSWGADFTERSEKAHRAFIKVGGEAVAKDVDELGLGDEPGWLELFDKIAKVIDDDGMFVALGGAGDNRPVDAHGRKTFDFSKSMPAK